MGKKKQDDVTTLLSQSSSMVQVTIPQIIMSQQEYITLTQENIKLKTRVAELEHNEADLTLRVSEKNREIEQIKSENEMLRQKISHLEEIIDQQNKKIDIQNNEIITLKGRLDEKDAKEKISKLIIAIQDLNFSEQLEQQISIYSRQLSKFRKDKNNEHHYFINNDTSEQLNYKKNLILEQLKNVTPQITNKFEKKYSKGFIDAIIQYLKLHTNPTTLTTLTTEEQEEIAEWWE